MPVVSEGFIKSAMVTAEASQALLEKVAKLSMSKEAADKTLVAKAEVVADTLIAQGLLPEAEKSAAMKSLQNHEEALNTINRIAQQVPAPSYGAPVEKSAAVAEGPDSDAKFLSALGF